MKHLELIKASFELEQSMQQINTEDSKAFALNAIVGGLNDLSAVRAESQAEAWPGGTCAEL